MNSGTSERQNGVTDIRNFIKSKPLQASKLAGISLTLLLGVLGFFRIISADAVINDPRLADGQFLTVILIPLLSLVLVLIVVCETLISSYRAVRADALLREQFTNRPGYIILRSVEASIAIVGFSLILAAIPVLVAESTPAPAGVGLMIALVLIGVGILIVSLIRVVFELYSYANAA